MCEIEGIQLNLGHVSRPSTEKIGHPVLNRRELEELVRSSCSAVGQIPSIAISKEADMGFEYRDSCAKVK